MKSVDKSHSFGWIWLSSIDPSINECVKECDELFSKRQNLEIKNIKDYKGRVYKCYYNVREDYKRCFHNGGKYASLDITKLGAIVCYALILNKPFSINFDKEDINKYENKKYLINTALINYKIAFRASMRIIYNGMIAECVHKDINGAYFVKDQVLLANLVNAKCLKHYEYNKEDDNSELDTFEESMVKNLAFFDANGLDFDFTGYSIILTGIKEYNKLYYSKS